MAGSVCGRGDGGGVGGGFAVAAVGGGPEHGGAGRGGGGGRDVAAGAGGGGVRQPGQRRGGAGDPERERDAGSMRARGLAEVNTNVKVVKVGGAALSDERWLSDFARAAASASAPLVVVHGGGPDIS